jgi:hypothetical protein
MTLANWSESMDLNGRPPKAKYSLVSAGVRMPPECVRWRGRSVQLCEDAKALSIVGIRKSLHLLTDLENRPLIFFGAEPVEVVLYNGTGSPVAAALLATNVLSPPSGFVEPRLSFRCAEQFGSAPIAAEGTQLRIPLTLAPGSQTVTLTIDSSIASAGSAPAAPLPAGTRLLCLSDFRLDSDSPAVMPSVAPSGSGADVFAPNP